MVEKAYQRLKHYILNNIIGSLVLPIILLNSNNLAAQEIKIISDEETEVLLEEITQPLFKAAGLPFNRNEVYIVEDNSLNAFVADGNNLFINTGTIIAAESPNEIAGVIAHETGHIAGGHIIRQKLKNRNINEVSLVSAIAAGAAAALSGRADVAMAAMLGSQSSILTNYTRYRTEEERSADDAAIKLLKQTKQSPQGMLAFMKKIVARNQLQGIEETPYFRTHPITRERISFFEQASKNSNLSPISELQNKFNNVKAKLIAYLLPPTQTLKQYAKSNRIDAHYARAIAYFRMLNISKALNEINILLQKESDNPYFHELKGQIFLETGKIKQAKSEYKKALEIMPSSALFQISFAQTLLEDNHSQSDIQEAINLLNKAIIKRPNSFAWLLLSRAYGLQENLGYANYAAAEYSLRIGAPETAQEQLKQSLTYNPDQTLKIKIADLQNKLDNLLKK